MTSPEVRNITKDYHVNLISPKCAQCDNKFCGGTCLAANYEENGSVWIPTQDGCRISKKQWDNAMQLYGELKDEPNFNKAYKSLIEKHDVSGKHNKIQKSINQKPQPPINLGLINGKIDRLTNMTVALSNVILNLFNEEAKTDG